VDLRLGRFLTPPRRSLRRGATLVVAGVAAIPVLRMIWILTVFGANNVSNDEGPFIGGFLSAALSGGYHWFNLPRDTFINTHSDLIPGLIYIVMAHLTRLNAYSLLYVGVALDAAALCLLYASLARPSGDRNRGANLLLAPMLSGLVFSVTQISAFEFPLLTIKTGLNQFGLALGIWGLARFPKRWAGLAPAIVGGIIASLSNATGIAMWPAFALGLFLLGFRKVRFYVALLAGAAISVAPYLLFLSTGRTRTEQYRLNSLLRPSFIIDLLGGAFANGKRWFSEPLVPMDRTGILGILLLAAAVLILIANGRRELIRRSSPALMLLAFGLLCGVEIGAFRQDLAPWYTPWSMDFWIGLAALAYVFWMNEADFSVRSDGRWSIAGARSIWKPAAAWSVTVVLCIAVLGLRSNQSHSDKSFYLVSRSPASATCLRNYKTAPTYCQCRLAEWPAVYPDYLSVLGRPMEQNQLSVFAPSQEWSMQGDSYLSKVTYHEERSASPVFWTADSTDRQVSLADYRRLNLYLQSPNWASWKVELPSDLKSADFYSAVMMSSVAPREAGGDLATAALYIQEDGVERLVYSRSLSRENRAWQSITIPLRGYAGKTITIRLGSDPNHNSGSRIVYRYPYISLVKGPGVKAPPGEAELRPSNTDLSADLPTTTQDDFRIPIEQGSIQGLEPAKAADPAATAWNVTGHGSFIEYTAPVPVALADYSHFFVRIMVPKPLSTRAIRISYSVMDDPGFSAGRSFVIPLLSDRGMHSYSFDLRLLPETNKSLVGLRVEPVDPPWQSDTLIEIADVRLIHK